jgi:Fe2+ transport system protein FeoA
MGEEGMQKTSTVAPTSFTPEACSLSLLSTGEHGTVIALTGGRGVLGKMASLGFTPGVEISVVQNIGRGPLIVSLRGMRVALGRHEAYHVQVRRSV